MSDEKDIGKKKEDEKLKEIQKLLITIVNYPVTSTRKDYENAKNKIVKMYPSLPLKLKSYIIFFLHEYLSATHFFRTPPSVEDMKRDQKSPTSLGVRISKELFSFPSSLDGFSRLISLLSELGDEMACKVISYYLSRALMLPHTPAAKMLVVSCIHALRKCETPYALWFLLDTFPEHEGGWLVEEYVDAIIELKSKLNKMKISKKEKEELLGIISELIEENTSENTTHYG